MTGSDAAAQERSCSKKRKAWKKGEQVLAVDNHIFPDNLFLKSVHQNLHSGQTSYYILKIQHIVLVLELRYV